MKNLAEEGFHVTGFEQRSKPGGIWSFTKDPGITSTTKSTTAQLSRYMVRCHSLFVFAIRDWLLI